MNTRWNKNISRSEVEGEKEKEERIQNSYHHTGL